MRAAAELGRSGPAHPYGCYEIEEYAVNDNMKPKSRRGFASMDPARLKEVSSRGGLNVSSDKRPWARDPEAAKAAGEAGRAARQRARKPDAS